MQALGCSDCETLVHFPAAVVQVRGPARDLHSGNDGGVFNEPLADLTKVPPSSASVRMGN